VTLSVRTIGKTDIQVTTLGFGGGPLGSAGDGVGNEQVAAIVEAAWKGGIRYFDTAPLYGHGLSEKRLGSQLSSLPRDEFVLSSKVGRLLVPRSEGIRSPRAQDNEPFGVRYDYSYEGARRSLEASLQRLNLDRIDIMLCHDIDVWTHGDDQTEIFETAARGILPAMADLRAEGVIRAIGLGVNEAAVCVRVMENFDVDCFLLAGRFTLLEQSPLDDLLPKCKENQVSLIIGGPYNSGILAVADRERATYDYEPVDDDRWEKANRIRNVCEAHEVDIRAASLQYPLRHPAVASVIPGIREVDEMTTNLALINAEIPDALWDDLAAAELVRKI